MTKDQLIEALKDYPGNMDIFLEDQTGMEEFKFNLLEEVREEEITFTDESNPKECTAKEKCIILSQAH